MGKFKLYLACCACWLLLSAVPCLAQEHESVTTRAMRVASGVLLPLALAGGLFIGACAVVALSKRPAVIAAYSMFLLLPLLLTAYSTLKSITGTFSMIAMSESDDVPAHQMAMLWGELSMQMQMTLMLTLPSFFVVSIGLFVRTLQAGKVPTATVVR